MRKTVAILGALDTKGDDFAFVKRRIEAHGLATLLLDVGVLGKASIPADIPRDAVAQAAGVSLSDLVARHDRGAAVTAMTQGATIHVLRLFSEGRIDAVMGMGGGAGTTLSTAVMRKLPIGFPKLMVSTIAGNDTRPYIGTSDIAMMPSVVDVAGLNRVSRLIYTRAADAICGMAAGTRWEKDAAESGRPLVAATMFGNTTACVTRARDRLEAADIEVLIFHANGGGRTMEHLVDDGQIDGVLDATTTEWADELVGGIRSAGPDRLTAAGRKGVPQVVSVGALDMVNFGAPDTVPLRFAGRRFHQHNAQTTLMRTSPEESAELGHIIASRLNVATGPVVLLLPLRGISALDAVGEPFDDPRARGALFAALRANIDSCKVDLREIDAHINDPAFADIASEILIGLLEARSSKRHP